MSLNATQFVESLIGMAQRFEREPMRDALEEAEAELMLGIAENFRTSTHPNNRKWKKRKDRKPHPLLILTGRLMGSATSASHAEHVRDIADRSIETGTEVPYAEFHELGTQRIPIRAFITPKKPYIESAKQLLADRFYDAVFG